MSKKATLGLLVVVTILISPPDLYSAKFKEYQNTKYYYSLEYPASWYVSYLGKSEKEAPVIRFCVDENDAQFSDGGSTGPLVEIIVSNIKELNEMGSKMPKIKSPEDWIGWERSNWDKEEKERIGPYLDEVVIIGGVKGIKSTYKKPVFPGAGPTFEIIFYNTSRELIYNIKYLGSEPAYSQNLKAFEKILNTFSVKP